MSPMRIRLAEAIGGGLDGSPRQPSIFRIASGGWIAAMILGRPPQRGQSKTSTQKILRISSAHVWFRGRLLRFPSGFPELFRTCPLAVQPECASTADSPDSGTIRDRKEEPARLGIWYRAHFPRRHGVRATVRPSGSDIAFVQYASGEHA